MKIVDWGNVSAAQRHALLTRPVIQQGDQLREQTQKIIEVVRQQGDSALRDFTTQFDRVTLDELHVTHAELAMAKARISIQAQQALEHAAENIRQFHQAQCPQSIRVETQPGIVCEKISRPIQRVGLYIPGGNTPLPSTVLMLGIPSQLAGNPQRALCTPPNRQGTVDPHILYAAQLCGIETVFKVGGAHAIAALAYGTASIPKVDKIFGPGNAWVTQAKQVVAHDPRGAALDMPAGPSEVLVVADVTADPLFVAADLLSQLEHGADSQAFCVVTDTALGKKISHQVQQLLPTLERADIIDRALQHSAIITVDTLQTALTVTNTYAPEHLILHIENPTSVLDSIYHAGSIFMGPWAPESVGDYASGTNHVLPTYGYAKQYSGLSVADFCRYMTVQTLTKSGLQAIAPTVITLAELEQLSAHRLAVCVRMEDAT